ncbi:fatty acid hydroxylase domain-containing protein 2-like isoform X2 [Clavelina lepadiformis]|uniref:Fatty acid hydroxylase domain-containing protein n=1 Tax=Clavelina lepadiformis TaxID=159417 RepID=A0ABP0H2M1_CLALP
MDFLISLVDMYYMAHGYLCEQWGKVLSLFGNDDHLVFCAGTTLILVTSFMLVNSFFMYLDYTGKPAFMHRYKIRKDKNIPVEKSRFIRCCIVSFGNHFVTCLCVWLLYPVMKYTGMSASQELPHIWRVYLEYQACVIIDEIVFYYTHRLMHWPPFYKAMHKWHHEWVAPISIAAIYNHPVEHLVSHVAPLLSGPILVGCHLSLAWYWIFNFQVQACLHHSNYHLPFFSSPQFHDYHHYKFTECFGSGVFLDRFHKTDKDYQKSIQFKRNVPFYSLSPITELIPDSNRKKN